MSKRKSNFVTQAAVLAAAMLIARFIGFLYRLPLTDLIGDSGNAIYSAAYNIYSFILVMSSSGLPSAISKMVSERTARMQYKNAHQVFLVALQVATVTGLAGAIMLAFFADGLAVTLSGFPESSHAIRTLSPTVFIVAIMAVFRGYFQGLKSTFPTAISQVIEQIFNAAFSVWLAYILYDAAHIEFAAAGGTAGTGIGALAGLATVLFIYMVATPSVRKRQSHDKAEGPTESRTFVVAELFRTAFPIILGTAVFSISNFIDAVMVPGRLAGTGIFTDGEVRQLYGQLTGKFVVLTTLPVAISAALAAAVIPSIAASHVTEERGSVKAKINMALRLSMIVSIPAAVGIGVLGGPILALLFKNHVEGGELLSVGSVCIIFLAVVQIVTGILQGIGKVNLPVVGAVAGILIKIPFIYFLVIIPSINIIGAVISTIACYAAASAIDLWFLYRNTRIVIDFVGAFVKPGIASAAMGLACYIIYHACMCVSGANSASAVVAISIGMAVYLVFMYWIKGFKREDIMMFPGGRRIARYL